MTDEDVEQTDQRVYGPDTYPAGWANFGTVGAVGLIVFGGVAAAWVFFRLPGTPEELTPGYYQAAKVLTIGLVIVGSGLLGRQRARAAAAATKEANEPERP